MLALAIEFLNIYMYQPASIQSLLTRKGVFAEQVRLLYASAPALFLLQFFFASFLAIGMARLMGQKVVFWGWLCLVIGLVLAFFSYVGYKSAPNAHEKPKTWYLILLITALALSLIWSAIFVYMLANLHSPAFHSLVVAMLAVAVGCGVTLLAVRALLVVMCNLALLTAPIIWLGLQDSSFYYLLAALLLLLGVGSGYFGWIFAKRQTLGIAYMLDNQTLQEAQKIRDNQLSAMTQQLQQISATDALTQVANRRYFEGRLQSEWRRIAREQDELALLLIDIDRFGNYNNHFGHQAGDLCIARIALCVRDSLRRPADLVARLSGNVFVVLLPNTPAAGAVRVGEMIRENVIAQEILNPSDDNPKRLLSVTIGIAHAKISEDMPRSGLIACAEAALLAGQKQQGNKVIFKNYQP